MSEQKEKKLTPKKIYGQALLKKCYENDGQPQVAQKVFLENEKDCFCNDVFDVDVCGRGA